MAGKMYASVVFFLHTYKKIVNYSVRQLLKQEISFNADDVSSVIDDSNVPMTCPKGTIEVNEINWEQIQNAIDVSPPTNQGNKVVILTSNRFQCVGHFWQIYQG